MPRWGVISSAGSPVLLVTGSTVAAGLQPRSFNPVADTISSLAAVGAVDRWVMTSALVGVGVGYAGLALRPAALAGRLILMAVGVATVLVALNPEHAGHGGSLRHTLWAATGFIVMTAWPVAGRVRGSQVPFGLRPAVAISATVVMLGLLAWFGAELIWAGHQVGLAERALAGIQALWPLAVVLTCTGSGRFRACPGDQLLSRPVEPHWAEPSLAMLLDRYRPEDGTEVADVRRLRALIETTGDPWRRELALHVTASVLITHPPTARVLLRWHQRQQAWLQVGGHGDPGESDPLAIAAREAYEETGLPDLEPWPDAQIRHVVIVGVPAGKGEPAHEHADVRFLMATQTPDEARAENAQAPLRWLSLAAAREVTSEPNLRETLSRAERLLTH
jgi:8-oxo-dGTP pyrophosphatase MutT (NUDIX family)